MPWNETSPMNERTQFIADFLRHRLSMSELCERYSISRRRRRIGHPGRPSTGMDHPNQVWAADFKGHFKTGDGIYCYPLTVTDGYSRYLLACHGLLSTACADAKPIFTRPFRAYGLPERIRTDNGVPFATNTLARLSSLSAWWVRLGILPELIEPGKPQQNGRHERMHRTLKAETTHPPAATRRGQQRRFDAFRQEFNHERPHEALGQQTPAAHYTPSARPFPEKLAPLEYPAHFERRYVSANGCIRGNHHFVVSGQLRSSFSRRWPERGWCPPTTEVDTNAGREAEAVEREGGQAPAGRATLV